MPWTVRHFVLAGNSSEGRDRSRGRSDLLAVISQKAESSLNAKIVEILNTKGKTEIPLKLHDRKQKLINKTLDESECCPSRELQLALQDLFLNKVLK